MTNKEKAIELAEKWYVYDKIFLEMAEWKDQQFKEYLENRKKLAQEDILKYGDDFHIWTNQSKIEIINEIINEFFNKN